MIKIKVSYNTQDELEKVLNVLKPITHREKVKYSQNGKYKKVYITINDCNNLDSMV